VKDTQYSFVPLTSSSEVAVVGAGTMGAGIAQVAAVAGHSVKLFDENPAAASKGLGLIRQNLDKLVSLNRLAPDQAEATYRRIEAVNEINALQDVSLVVEAIFEDLSAKQAVFTSLEGVVSDSCVLATNTSSISISRLASVLKHPGRFVGMHFFNPVPRMALVEVVDGLATLPEVSRVVFDAARSWGKQPVAAKSTPGFIVNRVARPFYGEALRLLVESSITVETLDAIVRECGGFRMGPCELIDLIGCDINLAVTKSIWESFYFDPRFSPSPLQQELVDSKRLGRKTGRGFYEYDGNVTEKKVNAESPQAPPKRIEMKPDSTIALALKQRLPQSVEITELKSDAEGPVLKAGSTEVFLTDGRTAAELSYLRGISNVVLFDLCLDYEKAPRITLTHSPGCSHSEYQSIVGLFQSARYQVTTVEDTAAMVVMRIVAMLANEASETVSQQVCSETDLDIAMQLGTNHPIGPIAWSHRIGYSTLYKVLRNLGSHFGEDRYRMSPRIANSFWHRAAV
jgi:3-hydroxybutyryl-CoA dehydrogenase